MTPFHRALIVSLATHVGLVAPYAILTASTAPTLAVHEGPTSVASLAVVFCPAEPPALTAPRAADATPPEPPTPAHPVAQAPTASSESRHGAEWRAPQYRRNEPPRYPPEAYRQNLQGCVWLVVDVDGQGRPARVVVERSSGAPVLDEAAVQAVQGWEFMPAQRGGHPIPSRCRIPIQFRIEEVS